MIRYHTIGGGILALHDLPHTRYNKEYQKFMALCESDVAQVAHRSTHTTIPPTRPVKRAGMHSFAWTMSRRQRMHWQDVWYL